MPTKMPDGTIMYPAKGKPPKPLPGYYAEQPFVHKPLLKPCAHRGFKKVKRDCACPDRIALYCTIKGLINVGSCLGCQDREDIPFLRKAMNYGEALVYGQAVNEKVYTKRITTCQYCPYNNGGTCMQCGCNVLELARYEENLPKWGCKHPERGSKGWPV